MRLVFAGTPEFARSALERLHAEGHAIALVLTQPDRPAGRGLKLQASPVKQAALALGLTVAQPRSLRLDGKFPQDAAAAHAALESAQAHAMVVAAYGLILPQWVLDLMRNQAPPGLSAGLGCINIHASLLPRWRGAAPIHRAIEAGDRETGVTIMRMDSGLDTGPTLLAEALPIDVGETTGSLQEKLALLGARLMVLVLQRGTSAPLVGTPQSAQGVCYAHKIGKHEAMLDWTHTAVALELKIRAFDPLPGAATRCGAVGIKLWRAEVESAARVSGRPCGTVLSAHAQGVTVQCGAGVLRLTELQRSGGKRLGAREFLQGFALEVGTLLGPDTAATGPG